MQNIEMDKFVINTGNILNVNKKAGQKTAEEVSVTYFLSTQRIYMWRNYMSCV